MVAVGPLLGSQPGESLRLNGSFQDHPKYGRRFQVDTFASIAPSTVAGLERYLGSGLIPGIGATYAKRIVATFGLQTLDVLDHESRRLREVPGIGAKRAAALAEAWHQQRELRGIMLFLQEHGVSPNHATRIYRQFGVRARAVLREDPYSLAEHISGVGFRTADQIAAKLGISPESPQRAAAGVLHVLAEAAGSGDSYLPRTDLIGAAAALLEVADERVGSALDELLASGKVVRGAGDPGSARGADNRIYLPRLHVAETTAGTRLAALCLAPATVELTAGGAVADSGGPPLSDEQRAAYATLTRAKVAVLTGGPGTGKTTLLRSLVGCFAAERALVVQAAPTGRAAKRMEEASGSPASTIHRLLEMSPQTGGFARDRDNPLEVELLVIDEASMLDIQLLAALLDATPDGARLLLVGDADQLPSVGAGNVLADLVAAASIPTVRLTEVFRQGERSSIVAAAHQVNAGRFRAAAYVSPRRGAEDGAAAPGVTSDDDAHPDFYVILRTEPQQVARTVLALVTERIPQRFGMRAERDIQVLTPMHRGPLGTRELNTAIRQRLAGTSVRGPAVRAHGIEIGVGDRVIQTRNDYQLEVFNGDVGQVADADAESTTLVVDYGGRAVTYAAADIDNLALGYAITIHRSQGSEFPAVVMPLHTQHYVMLRRNLLYTAVTRARQLLVIVGSEMAIDMATRRGDDRARHSSLRERVDAAVRAGATPAADAPATATQAHR